MHTRLTADTHYGVYATRNTEGQQVWVGQVTHPVGETAEQLEQRWDGFARLMFAYGVEPVQDDPDRSKVVDGEVTDEYVLQEIGPDDNVWRKSMGLAQL